MVTIRAKNKEYTGISASVAFAAGVGYTDNPHLIQWFKDHEYDVEEPEETPANNTDKKESDKKE